MKTNTEDTLKKLINNSKATIANNKNEMVDILVDDEMKRFEPRKSTKRVDQRRKRWGSSGFKSAAGAFSAAAASKAAPKPKTTFTFKPTRRVRIHGASNHRKDWSGKEVRGY